jgi:hypothetical protein
MLKLGPSMLGPIWKGDFKRIPELLLAVVEEGK